MPDNVDATGAQIPRVHVSYFKIKDKLVECFTSMRNKHLTNLVESDKENNELINVVNKVITTPVNIDAFNFVIHYDLDIETQTYLLKSINAYFRGGCNLTFQLQTDDLIELFGGQPETVVRYKFGYFCELIGEK